MFLHLGGEIVVKTKDIIAIFDIESALKSKDSRYFFNTYTEKGLTWKISEEEARSVILVERIIKINKNLKKSTILYYSPISAVTLQKRSMF